MKRINLKKKALAKAREDAYKWLKAISTNPSAKRGETNEQFIERIYPGA